MPPEQLDEIKLAWKIRWLEVQVDKALEDREKIRADVEEIRFRINKGFRDLEMDDTRFKVQVWTAIIGGLAVILGGITAWLTWWSHGVH